jgi:hypothetical protein
MRNMPDYTSQIFKESSMPSRGTGCLCLAQLVATFVEFVFHFLKVSFVFIRLSPTATRPFDWHCKAVAGSGKQKIGSP